ncbi:glycoside hydrolase family 32 protein [Kribbella yunnanensis]
MRPRFHFTAPRGWINDPHGITYRDGQYHLFYQHVPDSLEWAPNCHWGHALSPDLFLFEALPIAIAPGDGDDGIWTGCLVNDRIFYTSVEQPDLGRGRVRIATPLDAEWINWQKGEVVAETPADVSAYRDPFVFRDGTQWRMWVGAALKDDSAAALSYVSDDLDHWTYDGIALQRSRQDRDPVWTGAMWECPQLLELDGRHVMITSVWDDDVLHYVTCAIGDHRAGKFHPETWGRLTFGDSHYAPTYFQDAAGRPCLTFWLRNIADPEAGWTGAHSIPYVLHLDADRLVATPHPGLTAYRTTNTQLQGLAADLTWTGTNLTISSGPHPVATITTTPTDLTLRVDEESWTMPYDAGPVRVILDGPILELATGRGLLAAAITPTTDVLSITTDGDLHELSALDASADRPRTGW